MGKNTAIEWATHSFCPWHGCEKVSPGCKNCYALRLDGSDLFEPGASRRLATDNYWRNIISWNAAARLYTEPTTVFVSSMSDVFDEHPDVEQARKRLWLYMERYSSLIFLVLTKRAKNVVKMIPQQWIEQGFPANVWLGVSIENQTYVGRLHQIAGLKVKKFVSVEPMLGKVNFDQWDGWNLLDWVIIGGETGGGNRPLKMEWARELIEGCKARNIPVFMKQLWGWPVRIHGETTDENWPDIMKTQEFPVFIPQRQTLSNGVVQLSFMGD